MLISLNVNPGDKELKQFGFIALVAFGLLGGVVLWRGGLFGADFGSAAGTVAYVLWTVGALSLLASLAAPRANRPLFVALSLLAYPIGFVVSHVVMAVLFFGLLTPVALLFRVIGRDPLERRFEPGRGSYWVDLPERDDLESYFRQF